MRIFSPYILMQTFSTSYINGHKSAKSEKVKEQTQNVTWFLPFCQSIFLHSTYDQSLGLVKRKNGEMENTIECLRFRAMQCHAMPSHLFWWFFLLQYGVLLAWGFAPCHAKGQNKLDMACVPCHQLGMPPMFVRSMILE